MKYAFVVALAMLGSIPAFAQDGVDCRAYFQVLSTRPGTTVLHAGMDSGQKNWWQNKGRRQYPGLCLDGSVTSGEKPRFLVIWSKPRSFGVFNLTSPSAQAANQAPLKPEEVYGQKTTALLATAPLAWIYQPRWNVTSVTIVPVLYDGSLELPPVYLAPGDLALQVMWLDGAKVLKAAVDYLAQEPVLSWAGVNTPGVRAASK